VRVPRKFRGLFANSEVAEPASTSGQNLPLDTNPEVKPNFFLGEICP